MTTEESHSGIEASIQEAMSSGKFDNLKGQGKPLDLHEYFETPEELRVGYSLLKSSGFIPQEVELRKEIAELRDTLITIEDSDRRKALERLLNHKQLAYDILLEAHRRHGRYR